MKITKRQLRSIVRESVRLLAEEEYDHWRDFQAGLISQEEYEDAVGRRASVRPDTLRPARAPAAAARAPASDLGETMGKLRQAMADAGLQDLWRDYGKMHAYLVRGYKSHPDYDGSGAWDAAAAELDRRLDLAIN